jgi:hypothetical protein
MSQSSLAQSAAPLHAALRALAAAPGRLYPVAYLGPLDGPAAVRRALGATRRFRHLRVTDEQGVREDPDASVVLCGLPGAVEIRASVSGRIGVQLLVVGPKAPHELADVERASLGPAAILVDVRPDLAAVQGGRIADAVDEAVHSAGEEPLVLLTPEDAFQETLEECELHLSSAGLRVHVVDGIRHHPSGKPRRGEAWLVGLRSGAASGSTATAVAAGCRAAAVPLVIVAVTAAWDEVRAHETWRAAAARCTVIRGGGGLSVDTSPWPPVTDLWIGGVRVLDDVEPAMRIPVGTPLVAALAHLEIGGRSGSLLVWGRDRVAVIRAEHRAPGAVVVDVRLGGGRAPGTRDEALRLMDSVRGWGDVEMAIVYHPHRESGCLDETVTRLGFFLSRTDDERSAGLVGPSTTVPPCAPADVARVLVQHALSDDALDVLRTSAPARGIEDAVLLASLLADRAPAEAVAELRDAAFRGASEQSEQGEALQIAATLNALLLLVRGRQIAAEDAWVSLEAWIGAAGIEWATTPQHAAIAFELACRSGHAAESRILASRLELLASSAHPLLNTLRAHIRTVLTERRAA